MEIRSFITPALSKVLNAIQALVVVLDRRGNIIYVNEACENLMGYRFANVQGKSVFEIFILPEELEVVSQVFAEIIKYNKKNKHTNYWRTANGDEKLISWSNTFLTDDNGELEYVVATGEDLTGLFRDKLALEERNVKFKAIINAASDAIIIIDDKGIVEELNPAVKNIFGYDGSELIGQNISILMSEPHADLHDIFINNYIETGKAKVIGKGLEVLAKHKNGHTFPIHLSLSENTFGGKTIFTGIIRDMTSFKKQEEKLRRAHKAEAIGQLTGGIAHDFNNLLTIILGNLEMLENKKLDVEAKDTLNEVFEVLDQGSELVRQLLALGKRQSLSPEVININKVVSHLTQLLNRTLREDIVLESKLQQDIWNCHADAGQLENALINIVLNARDAISNNGKITIQTRNKVLTKNNTPRDMLLSHGEYIHLSITDNGTGMTPQVLERVFDPFFTTKEVGIGTGLGLSMVHGFVEQSSGGINIDSTEGVGTTVSIYLPKTKHYAQHKDKVKQSDKINNGEGEIVLLVEDDARVRNVNTKRLTQLGYQVVTAKDAPTALRIIEEQKDIQILFSDIVMPGGMNGLELAEVLKNQQPKIKVLLTTGYTDEVLSKTHYDFPILKKPFSKSELSAKLQELMTT